VVKKIIVVGGSITVGHGWNHEIDTHRKSMWANQLPEKIKRFQGLEVCNLGVPGASNEMIFHLSVDAVSRHQNDIALMLCSWVHVLRYHYDLGFELYDTSDSGEPLQHDIGLNGITIPKKYVNDLKQRFFSLHHLHHEIVKILKYANTLTRLGKFLQIPVYHINDSCPWDRDYFTKKPGLPSTYTDFTKNEILNVDNRADEEIYELYDKLHKEYDDVGKPRHDQWINLYDSWLSLQIDANPDQKHPGHLSNQLYSDQIKRFFNTMGIF
jgi:hypothetical protein